MGRQGKEGKGITDALKTNAEKEKVEGPKEKCEKTWGAKGEKGRVFARRLGLKQAELGWGGQHE